MNKIMTESRSRHFLTLSLDETIMLNDVHPFSTCTIGYEFDIEILHHQIENGESLFF